jgi:Tol biopolymer transport system component
MVTQGQASREVWSSTTARIVGAPEVAPDGRRIAFITEEGGRTQLSVIGADGAHLRVLSDSLALRGSPGWAADGHSLVAAVVRDGEPRLMRIFLDGEPPVPLLSEYSVDPVSAPGGEFLVYSGADVGTTFPLRAAATDGRPHVLPGLLLTRGARRVAFLRDQHSLLFLRGEISHKDLWRVDLDSGAQRELVRLPRDFNAREFDVSPDGSEIVLDRVQENPDLELIERQR